MLASSAGAPLAELLATAMLAAGVAVVYQLLLGFTASQAGSIPAFGGGLAVLAVAYCVGVAPTGALVALALALAAGPLFAETGLALKGAAEIGLPALRGQQIVAASVGLGVALAVVAAISGGYLERGFVPPTAVVLATIVELEERFGGLTSLAPWIGLCIAGPPPNKEISRVAPCGSRLS